MQLMGRDDIINCDDLVYEDVNVPEWSRDGKSGTVRIRALSSEERDALEQELFIEVKDDKTGEIVSKRQIANARARLVARAVIDDKGQRVFEDSDVVRLGKKNGMALSRCFDVAARLSGMTPEVKEELGND